MKRMTDLLLIATLLLSMTSVAYSTKDWTPFIRMDNGDDPGENSTGNSNCWKIATCILVEGLLHDEIYSSTSQNLVQQGKAIDLDAGAVTNGLPYTFIDIEDNRTKSENLGNFPNYTRAYWGIASWGFPLRLSYQNGGTLICPSRLPGLK